MTLEDIYFGYAKAALGSLAATHQGKRFSEAVLEITQMSHALALSMTAKHLEQLDYPDDPTSKHSTKLRQKLEAALSGAGDLNARRSV